MAVVALTIIAIGCGKAESPVEPSTSHHQQQNEVSGTSTPFSAVAQGAFPVGAQLAVFRRATVQFHDISAAIAAGYTTEHEPCIPGMGIHARNEALMGDQVIDPARPELLLYEPTTNGGYRLVGVEYFQVVLLRDGDPDTDDVARPWFGPEPWPADWEVVTPVPTLAGRPFDEAHAGHIPEMPWHWDLHAWIWQGNPAGAFSPTNPSVRCQ
jgi:hypothetical protein